MKIKIKDYLKHLWINKYYGVIAYILLPLVIIVGISPDNTDDAGFFIEMLFSNYVLLALFMYAFGSAICRKILNASQVKRAEYKSLIEVPIRKYIEDLKNAEVALSDDINIYVSEMEYPFAYAIGQKTLVVSTGLLEYPNLMEAKVKSELFKMFNLGSSTILLLLGNNIIIFFGSLFLMFSGFIDALTGSRRKRFLGGSDAGDGAMLFLFTLLCLSVWTFISNLLLKSFVHKKTYEADEFINELGLGYELCEYLDLTKQYNRPHRIKLFEFAKPSVDTRIGQLQDKGVQYTF